MTTPPTTDPTGAGRPKPYPCRRPHLQDHRRGEGGRRTGAPRPGTASRRAGVQAGGEGGQGTGWSVGRGAPQSAGSSRQRRRGGDRPVGRVRRPWGGGSSGWQGREGVPAGRSGAAPHGVRVHAGGDGSGRGGAGAVARVRRLAGRGFKRAARAGGRAGWSVGCGRAGRGGRGGGQVAGWPCPRRLGRRGRLPGNHRTSLTWVNTQGDGWVGCPAHRESTPVIPGRASRPGSAPWRPDWGRSGRCSGVRAARKAGMQGAGTRAGAARGRDVVFALRGGPALATLGDRRGGGGGLGACYSLVDVIGVLSRCAGRPRLRPPLAANRAYRDKVPWRAWAGGPTPTFAGAPPLPPGARAAPGR